MTDAWAPQRAAMRQALREAELNQVEVAQRLGVTQKHISHVLNGKTAGSLELWAALAGLVGMEWTLAPPEPSKPEDAMITWARDELGLDIEPWQANILRKYVDPR
jgi:transcriptional regulator with XRE-family HTH domain